MDVSATSPKKEICMSVRVSILKLKAQSAEEEIMLSMILDVLSHGGDIIAKPSGKKRHILRFRRGA